MLIITGWLQTGNCAPVSTWYLIGEIPYLIAFHKSTSFLVKFFHFITWHIYALSFHQKKKAYMASMVTSIFFFSSCFWESSVASSWFGNLIHKVFFIKKKKEKYMDKRNFVFKTSINDYGFQSNMILRMWHIYNEV